jgi:hypothetical protein
MRAISRTGSIAFEEDETGRQAGLEVRNNLPLERVGAHRELVVNGNLPQVIGAHTRDLHCLFNRRVSLRGAVGNQPSVTALAVAGKACGPLARGQQGAERSARRRVLNYAASHASGKKFFRQAEFRSRIPRRLRRGIEA